jgi:RNA polymerase sigma-70 factor (ECF subfamily)
MMRSRNTIMRHWAEWESFRESLAMFVGRCVADDSASQKIVRQVLAKAADTLPVLDWPRRLETWLFQITRNRILDCWRRGDAGALSEVARAESMEGVGEKSEESAEAGALLQGLRPLVEKLPPEDRDLLVWSDYEGKTDRFIAKRLGVSLDEARERVHTARCLLRDAVVACCRSDLEEFST